MNWSVFFIGPMVDRDTIQFDKLVAAVTDDLLEQGFRRQGTTGTQLSGGDWVSSEVLINNQETITLIRPHQLFRSGSIAENVFDAIDDADLVVVNLTGLRPAVVYEMALAHALGIWTIPVSADSDDDFLLYLRNYRHITVDFDEDSIRTPALSAAVHTWLDQRENRVDGGNPFTAFYSAPIPDISSALGLASSYYENYLQRVLGRGAQIVIGTGASEQRLDVRGLVVVRPTGLGQLHFLSNTVRSRLQEEFGDALVAGGEGGARVQTRDHGSRTCEFIVNGWLVDVPRSTISLTTSPRWFRKVRHQGMSGKSSEARLEQVLVTRFFAMATQMVQANREIENPAKRFHYGTLDEIVMILKS